MLLEHGFYVDFEDFEGNTPLHCAASSEANRAIPLLIAFGADINKQNKFGETAALLACKCLYIFKINLK